MGAQQPPGHGLPPANYYLEYKWQYKETPFPNNGVTYWANPGAFWTWGVGSAYGSYSATFPEMDWPMGGHVEWLFHGNADWNGPIIDEKKNLSQIGPGVNYPALVNTGWHVTAQLRLNGTRYYYQDAALTYTLPDPYPQYDNNTETPQWSGAFQTQSQSNCPALAGATGVTNDFIIAYIHAYHP
jgi:hypothetical protein